MSPDLAVTCRHVMLIAHYRHVTTSPPKLPSLPIFEDNDWPKIYVCKKKQKANSPVLFLPAFAGGTINISFIYMPRDQVYIEGTNPSVYWARSDVRQNYCTHHSKQPSDRPSIPRSC